MASGTATSEGREVKLRKDTPGLTLSTGTNSSPLEEFEVCGALKVTIGTAEAKPSLTIDQIDSLH